MNVISVLMKRQYHLNCESYRNSCPVYKSNFSPPSSLNHLELERFYNFDDSSQISSPITAIDHDDNMIFLANDFGSIALLNKSCEEIERFHGHCSAIFDLKTRPYYSNHLLSASGDLSIVLWDIEKPRLVENHRSMDAVSIFFPAHDGSVKSVSFLSPNTVISGGRDGAIKLWDLRVTCAQKPGPVLIISSPHKLPPRISKRPTDPIRRLKYKYQPSNVVTCVSVHPTNNNYFYSSGIADNSIKVWDVRSCRRRTFAPTRIHTTENVTKSPSNHGYSHFTIHNTSIGSVLYASSALGNAIYAFAGNSQNPLMVFSGRYSNHLTKISLFGDDYLLSGSTDDRILIWNCDIEKSTIGRRIESNSIENRLPIFELKHNLGFRAETPLVMGDFKSQSIYCCSEPNFLWKWSFHNQTEEMKKLFTHLPSCEPFTAPENHEKTIQINEERSSSFETGFLKRRTTLTSITNWVHLETKRFKCDNSSEETPEQNNENRVNVSKSTSHKNLPKNRVYRKNLKRSLFNDNRKIKEFFTPLNS